MVCSELAREEQKVVTLEQELQRKLRLRDQKLKEFAARRHQERRQLIEDCESSESSMMPLPKQLRI
jgi:cell division protein ZapA (FtsZ GTPase activity inhibitor)